MGTERPRRRFFFVSAALTGTGLIRGELATLLWGGAFLFTWGYTVAAGAVVRTRWKREAGQLPLATEALPPVPVFLRWELSVEAVHSANRRESWCLPAGPKLTIPTPRSRGRYRWEARWVLRDWFGFLNWSPPSVWEGEVVVPVAAVEAPVPSAIAGPQGTRVPRRGGPRAGDPFDVRKYTPGDDLRRIHWPLYAHGGDLFVRTADPSPPPEGLRPLVLDLDAPNEEALDHRLGVVVGWLNVWDAEGVPWSLGVPATGLRLTAGGGSLESLAALSPARVALDALTPPPGGLLVTGPGTAAARAGGSVLVLEAPPVAAEPRPWWSRR